MDSNDEIHRHLNDSLTSLVLVLLFIDSLEGFEFIIKGCLISDCDIFYLVNFVFKRKFSTCRNLNKIFVAILENGYFINSF